MQELIEHDFTFFLLSLLLHYISLLKNAVSSLLLNPFTGLQIVDWSVKGDNMLQRH